MKNNNIADTVVSCSRVIVKNIDIYSTQNSTNAPAKGRLVYHGSREATLFTLRVLRQKGNKV